MIGPNKLRIHTLDGWRGVAILFVILTHVSSYTRYKSMLWANLGGFGVDIFFVLSGYIITLRFIEEREKSSTIDLRSFYVRRAFRILPLVVMYLLTLCVLSFFVDLVDYHGAEIYGSLLFFRNYQFAASHIGFYTLHFWSLSIEEHFYLLWPVLFLWLGSRRALWFAIVGALFCATWRIYDFTHLDSWVGRMLPGSSVNYRVLCTDVRFDGLLLGCVVAILLTYPHIRNFIFRNCPKEFPLLLAFLLLLNLIRTNVEPTPSTYLLLCGMLASTLVVEEGLAYKWLNLRPLVWIGTISYSLYVWQVLFLIRPNSTTFPIGRLSLFPYNVVCALVVSALSYYFIEKPCIALGKRLIN
jgi:peptidoglycan/LPS O-acetylase OafA/YrhL